MACTVDRGSHEWCEQRGDAEDEDQEIVDFVGRGDYCDDMDIIAAISALEMALPELGYSVPSGTGIRAAEEVLQGT